MKPALRAVTDGSKARARRVPKQERSIESRAKALQGARAALAESGYGNFTMRGVAAVSSLGVGTIYDYFESKGAILRLLLKERLALHLEIFDETIEETTNETPVAEFIDRYLERMRAEDMWSRYDVELYAAARDDDALAELLDRHHEDFTNRYVDALRAAGSKWPDADLRAVASHLISVMRQFEPGAIVPKDNHALRVKVWMVRKTFLSIVREVLTTDAGDFSLASRQRF